MLSIGKLFIFSQALTNYNLDVNWPRSK